MEQIYQVKGTLNRGFVGQIAYSISLPNEYSELNINFEFDKQKLTTITDEHRQYVLSQQNDYNLTDEQITAFILNSKTELQISVMMNDVFIGGMHNQTNPKQIHLTSCDATEGFIPQPIYKGSIKIIVIAFSVIQDDTNYALSLGGTYV